LEILEIYTAQPIEIPASGVNNRPYTNFLKQGRQLQPYADRGSERLTRPGSAFRALPHVRAINP